MMYLMLVVGFILLIKGADLFVDGSVSVAKILKIPSVIIGLTIVSMGTSAPEAAVSIAAGMSGNSDIALSNILGSNMFNLLVVVGVCALIKPVPTDKSIVKRDFPFNVVLSAVLLLFMADFKISRIEGVILLATLVAYLTLLVINALKNKVQEEDEGKQYSVLKSIILIVVGLAGVVLGGDIVVDNASKIAAAFGLSQTLIGLTIVAVGTSLPELVTSIVAASKGESGIALGNVVGSNIFNVLFILGMASSIVPINVANVALTDAIFMTVITAVMFVMSKTQEKTSRLEGLICVLAYVGYMAYAIIR